MRSKKVGIRIRTVQKLVDAGFYEFATGFFEDTQMKVFASENQRRLIQATALMAQGVTEGKGRCLIVLPTLKSEATIFLQGIFKNVDLPHIEWEYKAKQAPPLKPEVVITNQKTIRKAVLKKGQLHLPFDTLLFAGVDATLLGRDWVDINLILTRLREMGELHRISCAFLIERYVTDIVGWLEGLEQEVEIRMDENDPLPPEARRVEAEAGERFFREEFRGGKYNFVLGLTRKWRSKKALLKALYRSFPYYLATEGRRTWLEKEVLRILELGRNLRLVYQRKYRYRSRRTAPKAGRVIQVFVQEGEEVECGHPVLILKTATREIPVNASVAGRVTQLPVSEGTPVPAKAPLMEIKGWRESGLYRTTADTSYLATLDIDFSIMESLDVWLTGERSRRGPDWRPTPEEFEQKLSELARPRSPPEDTVGQLPKIYRYRPILPALSTARRRRRRRQMKTVERIVRVEGELAETHGKKIIQTMKQHFVGKRDKNEQHSPSEPAAPEEPAPELEIPQLKVPIDVAGYVAARLTGRLPRLGAGQLSKDELARQSRVHYSTFVNELAAVEIPLHRAYYAVTKYFGETHPELALTERDKRQVAFAYRDELIRMISRVTWATQRDGRGRPRRMLVYHGANPAQARGVSGVEGDRCKNCLFYTAPERACQLWFAAAREKVTRQTLSARAIRGQVFPEMSACSRFRGKGPITIPAELVTVRETDKAGELVEVPVCPRCDTELPKWPAVVRTVECPQCGTAHRKTHLGGLKIIPNAADALERELQLLCGYTPSQQPSEPRSLSVYISMADRWNLTPNQLQVEYPGGREVYALAEVGHVTCHEERLACQLQERGIRVTVKPPMAATQFPITPELAQAMQRERKERKVLPHFILGLIFSVRFHTERVREAIMKVRAWGGEWEVVAAQVEHELEEIIAYQEFEILRCLWRGVVTPRYLRGLEGRVQREVEALLRNLLTGVWEDERIIYPGAGRRWGKHAEVTVDIVLRVAAAKTMFDAARNYVNRQIRTQLRRLSAQEGFGWNSEPLFLHAPRDKPGRSVHLDLEELARMEARIEVVLSFLERKNAVEHGIRAPTAIQLGPEDFAESFHLGLFPRYAPKPKTTRKLRALSKQVLERPYRYRGHRYELWKAHQQHVQNLKSALLTEEPEKYIPLMVLDAMSEAQREVFQKRFGQFGRWLVRSHRDFQAALEGVLHQIERRRSTDG